MSKRMSITLSSEAASNLKKYANRLDVSLAEAFRRDVVLGVYFRELMEKGISVFKRNENGEVVELSFPGVKIEAKTK